MLLKTIFVNEAICCRNFALSHSKLAAKQPYYIASL
jgi:hypothetical protein